MNGILQDVRYALRQMRKRPGFTAAVVMTLALGIGANTALFTLIHALMLKALPVAKPEELYRLGDAPVCCVQTGLQNNWGLFSDSLYRQFQDHTPALQELAAFQAGETDLNIRKEGRSAAEHALGEFVSGNYFSTFGVHVVAGRNIGPTDDEARGLPVAVMSFRYWQSHYGSDPSVIRSAVTINGTPFAVIGIAPSGFYGDTLRENPPDFWMPLMTEPMVRRQNSLLHQSDVNWLYLM
jgi:MacB-like periplasmic core domain